MPWRRSSKRKNSEDSSESIASSKKPRLRRHKPHNERKEQINKLEEIKDRDKENRKQCGSEDRQLMQLESNEVKDNLSDDEKFVIINEINIIQVKNAVEEVRVMNCDGKNGEKIEGTGLINVIQVEGIFGNRSNQEEIVMMNKIGVTQVLEYKENNDEDNIGITDKTNIQMKQLDKEEENIIDEIYIGNEVELMDETNIMRIEEVVEGNTVTTDEKKNEKDIKLENRPDMPHVIDIFVYNEMTVDEENDKKKIEMTNDIVFDETNGILTENGNIIGESIGKEIEMSDETIKTDEEKIHEEEFNIMDENADETKNKDENKVSVSCHIVKKTNPCVTADTFSSNTRYIVNMAYLFEQIREKFGRDAHKPFDCTVDNMFITGQRWYGLKTEFFVSCTMCGMKQSIWSEPLDGAYVGGRIES